MKEKTFDYVKKNGERGHYDIFVFEERDDRIYGISKKSLSEGEIQKFKTIETTVFAELNAPVGSIRCFLKKNILN